MKRRRVSHISTLTDGQSAVDAVYRVAGLFQTT